MKNGCLKIRAFGTGQFYEFWLPNGKNILLDPYFGWEDEGLKNHAIEEIERADYIILTHAHLDHDKHLGYFARKFSGKVIVGAPSAQELWKYHKFTSDQLFFAYPGLKLKFDDITVDVFPAKHLKIGDIYDPEFDRSKVFHGIDGHMMCDVWGSMDSSDYLITTNDGMKLLIVSGSEVLKNSMEEGQKVCPDLLIRQTAVRDEETRELYTPQRFAELLVKYRAKVAMPMHYDSFLKQLGSQEAFDQYNEETSEALRMLSPKCVFLQPKDWTWYTLGMDISEE